MLSSSVQRSTDDFRLTPVERLYQNHLNQLTGIEKLQRMAALFNSMIEILAHQVQQEYGVLPDRERNYRIAQKLYVNEPRVLKLLDECYYGR